MGWCCTPEVVKTEGFPNTFVKVLFLQGMDYDLTETWSSRLKKTSTYFDQVIYTRSYKIVFIGTCLQRSHLQVLTGCFLSKDTLQVGVT